MNKPLRLGPWRHLHGVGWSRTFTHCEVDGIQTSSTGWKVWPPVEYEVPPLVSGPETGLEGRERADAAARALGWELESETPEGFEPGPPSAPLRASLYWKLAQGLVHLYRVAVAGDGSLVCREMDVGGGFLPLASVRWDAHAPCTPPGPWSLALDEAARVAEKATSERERYDATVKEVVDELRARRAAEEKAYSDAYGFGEGVPERGGDPMRPGEHQHRARVSAAWPGFVGESYLPGARLAPQPERYSAGFATGWAWRDHRWLDGHTPPAPIANHGGGFGWCWADRGPTRCACGGSNRFRVGSIYLCAECRESAGEVSRG